MTKGQLARLVQKAGSVFMVGCVLIALLVFLITLFKASPIIGGFVVALFAFVGAMVWAEGNKYEK